MSSAVSIANYVPGLQAVTVSKYIECTTNKNFSIHIQPRESFQFPSPTLRVDIEVDGQWMRTPVLRKAEHHKLSPTSREIHGVEGPAPAGASALKKDLLKRFKFGEIKTSTFPSAAILLLEISLETMDDINPCLMMNSNI